MLVQSINAMQQSEGFFAVTNDAIKDGAYRVTRETSCVTALLGQRPSAIIATYFLRDRSIVAIDRFGMPIVFVDSLQPVGHHDCPFVVADHSLPDPRGSAREHVDGDPGRLRHPGFLPHPTVLSVAD